MCHAYLDHVVQDKMCEDHQRALANMQVVVAQASERKLLCVGCNSKVKITDHRKSIAYHERKIHTNITYQHH